MFYPSKRNQYVPQMVAWFRETYPAIAPLMIHVPRATKELEKIGAAYGSADLILLHPTNGYSCMCILILGQTERTSDYQKRWRAIVENEGCKCYTVRTLYQFTLAVEEYLANSPYA